MSQAPLNTQDLERVTAPSGQNRTLTADAYLSQEVFDWELENIFKSTWVCVGRGDELVAPGQIRAIDVAGEGVLLARDREGALTAFSNV
jgi:glycine betaine catabolism A